MSKEIPFKKLALAAAVALIIAGCAGMEGAYSASKAYCDQEVARAAARELSSYETAEALAQAGCDVVQAIDSAKGENSVQ